MPVQPSGRRNRGTDTTATPKGVSMASAAQVWMVVQCWVIGRVVSTIAWHMITAITIHTTDVLPRCIGAAARPGRLAKRASPMMATGTATHRTTARKNRSRSAGIAPVPNRHRTAAPTSQPDKPSSRTVRASRSVSPRVMMRSPFRRQPISRPSRWRRRPRSRRGSRSPQASRRTRHGAGAAASTSAGRAADRPGTSGSIPR